MMTCVFFGNAYVSWTESGSEVGMAISTDVGLCPPEHLLKTWNTQNAFTPLRLLSSKRDIKVSFGPGNRTSWCCTTNCQLCN